jgi:hypothetical protein
VAGFLFISLVDTQQNTLIHTPVQLKNACDLQV